jgi:cellulose synthase/poly-beta-1,6-N-acetylglucosamine synthase-like glycosyltransferase
MNTIMTTICILLVAILAFNALYLFVFSIAGTFGQKPETGKKIAREPIKTLVLFPVYKEDEVILQSIKSFMHQKYTAENFTVVVIADALKEETMALLRRYGASVCKLPVSDKRNKAKAINYLLAQNPGSFDNCIVMDADNLVGADFLASMNEHFLYGAKVVQARRVAKSPVNNLSQLDTYSEIINNHIFRKGQRRLGFSSSLIGSGMAFEFELFKDVMKGMDVYSGFDKELELRLLERKVKIKYAEDILVYDEKVADHQVFINQRRRWVYAQIHFLRANFFNAIYQLVVKGNFDYANKVFQFIMLPRIMAIGFCGVMLVATAFFSLKLFAATAMISIVIAVALVIPVQNKLLTTTGLAAITDLPRAFANMLFATVTSGKASKKFLHTPHNTR